MSRWLRLSIVCALCVSSAGCVESRKEPQLELVDTAVLHTPEANHPLQNTVDSSRTRVGKPDLAIHGGTESFRLDMI